MQIDLKISLRGKLVQQQINQYIEQFKIFQSQFSSHPNYIELDDYGFALTTENKKINLLVMGITHGNEVIGLEIIDLLLTDIKNNNDLGLGMAFVLNNIPASLKNKRCLEKDLNRCFISNNKKTIEEKRAIEIEKIILNLKEKYQLQMILDLHQTSEPTKDVFWIMTEDEKLICYAHTMKPDFPIVTFPNSGFSKEGQTLTEFAKSHSIPAFVIEIGQSGFNIERALMMKNLIQALDVHQIFNSQTSSKINYYHINEVIPAEPDLKLKPNLYSFQKFKKNDVLTDSSKIYQMPEDGVIIFPFYVKENEPAFNLGYIAFARSLKND